MGNLLKPVSTLPGEGKRLKKSEIDYIAGVSVGIVIGESGRRVARMHNLT